MRVIDCPACAIPMQPFFAEGRGRVELDRCPKCTRLWFDVKELEAAAGEKFLPRLKGAAATRSCPVDKVLLDTNLIRGDVPIEECGLCGGALLDGQDFEQISGKPLRQVMVKPPPPPPKPKRTGTKEVPKVIEFACERCRQRFPISEAGNINGATVCRECSLKPWPNQPTWYSRGDDPLTHLLDSIVDGLFR
ncbi:MAG: zf-TFIIB domain-containing protein [Myxococcaceae bacterium]|nr:zf-TFIIB domain-containing protein [Myxococcaceae bacterium]